MPVKQFYQRKGLCAIISAVPEVQEVFHNTTQARHRKSRELSRAAHCYHAQRSSPGESAVAPAAAPRCRSHVTKAPCGAGCLASALTRLHH